MSMELTYNFDNPNNFDFDVGKIDFSQGAIWDENYPENRIFCAKFLDNFNGRNSDNQEITGELFNNPVIKDNRLYLDGTAGNGILYTFPEFQNFINKGTIILKFIPMYNGAPTQNQILFETKNMTDDYNRISLTHYPNGELHLVVCTETGSQQRVFINLSAVVYQEYIIEANFDLENGKLRLFLDGIMTEEDIMSNLVRTPLPNFLIGTNSSGSRIAHGYIRDFAIFSSVIHIDNYENDLSDYNRNYAVYFDFIGASLQKTDDFSFFVNFKNHGTTELNADYAEGNAAGAGYNNPQIVNGILDLAHDDIRYVDYEFDNNFKTMTEGSVRFGYIPNYNSTPSKVRFLFQCGNFNGLYENSIYIYHSTNQALAVGIRDMRGITYYVYYNWYPIQGQEYHFEFNWSVVEKKFWLYIDGQKIIEKPLLDNFVRSLNGSKIRLGSSAGGDYESNQSYTYLQILKQVLHDSSVASFDNYDKSGQTIYPIQQVYFIEPKTKILTDGLESAGGDVIETADGDRHYIVVRENDLLYWDGNAWQFSDGSWDQANDPMAMILNLPKLDLTAGYNCTFRTLIKSISGLESDTIKTIVINYNFYGGNAVSGQLCTVYGYLYDPTDTAIPNAKIIIELIKEGFNENKLIADQIQLKLYTNQYGYFETNLIPNPDISPRSKYKFTFRKGRFYKEDVLTVPTGISNINYKDLK